MLKNFKTYQLALEFYKASQKIRLPSHLKNQFDRASSSIVLNLAEGSGKPSSKEQKRFYSIAMGSLRECEAVLDITDKKNGEILSLLNQVGACLYRLCYPR